MEGIFFSRAQQGRIGYNAKTEAGPVKPSDLIVEGPAGKGRPNSLTEEKRKEMLSIYYSRPLSLRKLGRIYGVSRMTIWRAVQSAQPIQLTG